jgi:nucleoside-diphosphate-sugar epimerase
VAPASSVRSAARGPREGYGSRPTRGWRPPEEGIDWVDGALDRDDSLAKLCEGADAIVHIAGLINASSRAAFDAVNVGGTANLIDAARGAGVRRFVHISSLAAREPELSNYGRSKARSELVVAASGLDWTIIRPPAVYGPGDRETFELFKMARRGLVALPPRGRFSVIHVEDLCRLILAVLDEPETISETYEPDDGVADCWEHRHFARTLGRVFGKRAATVAMPKVVMHGASHIERLVRRDKARLTPDRVRYFCHPDWVITAENRPPEGLWNPQIRTPAGLKQTAEWYAAQGWLK